MTSKPEYYLEQLHSILSKDAGTTAKNVAALNTFLKSLCEQMKEIDPLFNLTYKRLVYTGSSYEGLRIWEVDEFDINLVLKLPFPEDKFELAAERPGHLSYTLVPGWRKRLINALDAPARPALRRLFRQKRKLQPGYLRRWFQGVVDKALKKYPLPSEIKRVQPSQSGPAKTLYVHLSDGAQIDIDLVPVFEYEYNQLPPAARRQKWIKGLPWDAKKWFLVPKNPEDNEDLWRIHFPTAEKELMKDLGCIKPTIRLIKALRDRHEWKQLSSYAIKTVVIRHSQENGAKSYWHMKNQWKVLLEVLQRLQTELPSGIHSLTDERVSLTDGMALVTRQDIANRLKIVVDTLEKSPQSVFKFFLGPQIPALPATGESFPAVDDSAHWQPPNLPYTIHDASLGDTSAGSGMYSGNLSFVNNTLEASHAFITADHMQEADIESKSGLADKDNKTDQLSNPISVTMSLLASDGRVIEETSSAMLDHTELTTILVTLNGPSNLTETPSVKLRVKHAHGEGSCH